MENHFVMSSVTSGDVVDEKSYFGIEFVRDIFIFYFL